MGEILAIVILSIILYGSTIWHHYVSDDLMVYASSPQKPPEKPVNKWVRLYWQFMGRAYWDSQKRQGARRRGRLKLSRFFVRLRLILIPRQREAVNTAAHAMTIVLHTMASILVYLVFSTFGYRNIAWLGAIYFLVSPVNHEGSLWLSGKHYVMTACVVMTVWLNPILTLGLPWAMKYLSITALPFPAVFLPTMWWPFVGVIWWMYKRKKPNISKGSLYEEATEPMRFTPKKIILALKFYGYNVYNGITATHCTQFQGYMAGVFTNSRGKAQAYKLDKYFFIGVFTVLLTIYGLIKQEPWGYGLFWFSILVAPFCNLFSIGQQLLTSRYNYLAHAGLYYALAFGLIKFPFIAGGALFWYINKLLTVKQSYRNDYWNTTYATFDESTYVQTWIHMGAMHYSRQQFNAAILDFIEGKEHDPDNFHCWYNLSSCYVCLGKMPEAIKTLERAKKCELLFQEYTRNNVIKEREVLIGRIHGMQKRGEKVELKMSDVPILV